jgi:hypothetical protein
MTTIGNVEFSKIAARIANHLNPFDYNTHHSFRAITRSGKSHLIRYGILPLMGMSRIVVIDIKPGGSRVWNDYGNDVTELKSGFGKGPDGTPHYRLLAHSREQTEQFLRMISNDGSCVIVFDDSRRITANKPDFGLGSYVDELMTIGGEIGITIIICANSTVWSTSGLRDQCSTNWIGQMPNEDERNAFIKQAGLPKTILPILGTLPPHQFVYSDRHDGKLKLAITEFKK